MCCVVQNGLGSCACRVVLAPQEPSHPPVGFLDEFWHDVLVAGGHGRRRPAEHAHHDALVNALAEQQGGRGVPGVVQPRRADPARAPGPVTVGGLAIDARGGSVLLDSGPLDLSPKEFDLLLYLAERAGEVIGKRELLSKVWNQPYGGADKTVDVHLHWLRRKLGESADAPRYLHRVRGVGVKIAPPP